MKQNKTVIGIVGRIGAGKDEAAKYLSEKLGWPIFQISAPLKNEVKQRGQELNRENIQKMGVEFAKKHGDDYLARLALKSFGENGIVSGPRQLGQIRHFQDNSRFILVFIDADDQIRYKRVVSRATVKEAKTLREFIDDEREKDVLGPVQRLEDCISMANYKVTNNFTLEELKRDLDKIIRDEKLH